MYWSVCYFMLKIRYYSTLQLFVLIFYTLLTTLLPLNYCKMYSQFLYSVLLGESCSLNWIL